MGTLLGFNLLELMTGPDILFSAKLIKCLFYNSNFISSLTTFLALYAGLVHGTDVVVTLCLVTVSNTSNHLNPRKQTNI